MEYFLTEEQIMIRDSARQVAEERVIPVRAELDEREEFPHEIMKILAQMDLFRIFVPEAYDGLGSGNLELAIAIEQLSRACLGVSTTYSANALGAFPIILHGSEEQKQKYLPSIANGMITAFALTEANAGSDAAGIQTFAVKDGNDYILNGTKQWITNAGEAEVYTVIAITDKFRGARGASAFIVDKGTPGFSFGKKEAKLGIRASSTRGLIFEDCRIPKENLIAREGMGFIIAMKTLDNARTGVAAQGVGIGQGAFEEALNYARQRVQFGSSISSLQAIQHMLADMATQIEAARALTYAACRHLDSGGKNVSKEAAIAKLFATDMAMKVTTDAVQVLGGYGFMREYPVEKMMRDAKILQIYEGTNQIQRNVIAQALIKEAAGTKR